MYLSISSSTYLPIYLSTYLPIYLSTYLPIYLSIYLSLSLSFCCLSIYLPVYLQAWKRSYSARRPQVLNLTTAKRKQFSETSSMFARDNGKNEAILRDFLIFRSWQHQKRSNSARLLHFFELDNIQNEAILRDFFNFWTWQHQKQSNSARLPSKMESWLQSFLRFWLGNVLRALSSLIFSLPLFSSLWLFPSLLFICPYCRKFDF